MTLSLDDIDFHHSDPYAAVFEGVSLRIDTSWRTGLVGRNGRGKTTLLRLIAGELKPTRGAVHVPVDIALFPWIPADPTSAVIDVVRDAIAPFALWEQRMETLLERADEPALAEYGDLLERYQNAGGFEIDARIEREFAAMDLPSSLLRRPFSSLSGGEQTRALIIPLFLGSNSFALIDEPTNHLDMAGRELLAEYLARQTGFILVSHDRALLDAAVDHVVAINRSDIRVMPGNYSQWRAQADLEEEHERRRDANLQREIRSLEETAALRRKWSQSREKEKRGAYDKGFIGHRAAKLMKRALATERKIDEAIEDRRGLLGNRESDRSLELPDQGRSPEVILSVSNLSVDIDGRRIIDDLSLTLNRGERVAIVGRNGSGKTTLLRAIAGDITPDSGTISLPSRLTVARSYQEPLWSNGLLREHLKEGEIEETRFRTLMAAFRVMGDMFERPLETFSRGELKKVDLVRSFLQQSHLLLWDEPMNFIDITAREQIEDAILEAEPTMLFVEHDRWFVESVATRVVELPGTPHPQPQWLRRMLRISQTR
jgi:lincosamide and streptogramin A transport system ATP-binding/permease protein